MASTKTRGLLCLLLVCITWKAAKTQKDCYNNQEVGDYRTGDKEDDDTKGNIDTTVIILDTGAGENNLPPEGEVSHTINCCGVVKKWRIDPHQNGLTAKYQIWRPQGSDSYYLVGETENTPTDNNPTEVPVGGTIYVQVGDKLGFTGNSIDWETATSWDRGLSGHVVSQDGINPVVGSSYLLATEHPDADDNDQNNPEMIGWAIEAVLGRRDNPECEVVAVQTSFQEDAPVGTVLATVSTSKEIDPDVTGYDYSAVASRGLSVTVDTATGVIRTNANLTASYPSSTYTITAKTTEQICLKYATCTVSVKVIWVNHPIEISNLPATGHLVESTDAVETPYVINTYDLNRENFEDLSPNCSVKSTLPANGPFTITPHFISTQFNLQYDGSAPLDSVNTPMHRIVVACEDEHGTTATGTFTLSVDKNSGPNVTSTMDASGKICGNVSAVSIKKFDVVLKLAVFDAEGDDIITTFRKTDPDSPFDWDAALFQVYATEDLVATQTSQFGFSVDVSDKWNKAPTTYAMCLNIFDRNIAPVFTNCPKDVYLPENTNVGSEVFVPAVIDSNKIKDRQTYSFSMNVYPVRFESSFTLNPSSGAISISGSGIGNDYETTFRYLNRSCIRFELTVTDGVHFAAPNCRVCVYITNVNEKPMFGTNTFAFSMEEHSSVLPLVSYMVADEDLTDTHTYSILSGNGEDFFSIDPKTGKLSVKKDCDYEGDCPESLNLNVEVTDEEGLTDQATIEITIEDINDNSPEFSNSVYSLTVTGETPVNQNLLSIPATDLDSGSNGQISYTVLGSGYGQQYLFIDEAGNLGLKKPIDYADDTEYIITICGTDHGSPSRTGCTRVVISYPKITTLASDGPTKPQPCFFCTEGGVAIFTLCVSALAVIIFVVFFVLFRKYLQSALFRFCKRLALPRKAQLIRITQRKKQPTPQLQRQQQIRHETEASRENLNLTRIKKSRAIKPATPVHPKFEFWNEGDSELHNKNPSPIRYAKW